jgi:hypothetical protein
MNRMNWRAITVSVLSLALLNTGLISAAQAGVVETSALIHTARDTHIASIQAQLARAEVRAQLERYGVAPAEVEGRLAAMSDRELATLAERMNETPAGGDGLLAVIGLTFVVLIILELTGVINIFNRA